ncbi:hypothetical protein ACFMPD_12620 [Sedimentitalea sp. HM32M-2]|uniref:hypothetical protein n=1 Tax=Sedimentitalea sp. HM32M-2 TaxID=3351566 RepID=UPI00362A7A25
MAADFTFSRQGRSPRILALLIAIYATLVAAVLLIDAAWWLMLLLALPTLPALWDVVNNTGAGLCLGDTRLNWHSGRRSGTLELAEIDHVRMDTRWDFSVRVRAVQRNGKRVQLPFESVPPHRDFETALQARGVSVRRGHFSIL